MKLAYRGGAARTASLAVVDELFDEAILPQTDTLVTDMERPLARSFMLPFYGRRPVAAPVLWQTSGEAATLAS